MSPNVTDSARPNAGHQIAVVGAGYMGGGIAQVLGLSGADVRLADVSGSVARANYQRLLAETAQFVADGLFPADAVERVTERLSAAETIEDAVAGAEFVMEAVPEQVVLKHPILERISRANPDAVVASNTSTISIGLLAESVERPERFLGVHFSNPAPFIPGVEIIPHQQTAGTAVELARVIIDGAGKQGAVITDVTGFVLNRLQYALFSEASRLVEEGVTSAEEVDRIARTTFGFRLPFFGPFVIADMAGLDVYAACYDMLEQAYPERFRAPQALGRLVEEGHLGTKTGGGFLPLTAEQVPALIAYRNRAYHRMQQLLDELGPAPTGPVQEPEAEADR